MSRHQNPKKLQIIQSARALFWKFGMKRVSIEEICREANVSKMTYYKYFRNKNDLAMTILDIIQHEGVKKYKSIMQQNIPFEDKVKQTIQLKMDGTNNLSPEFLNDLHLNGDPEVKAHFHKIYQESIQMVLNDYIEAQKRGDIRTDIEPKFILYFLNHMIEMTDNDQLLKLYKNPQDMIMELTNFFFYGIMPKGK